VAEPGERPAARTLLSYLGQDGRERLLDGGRRCSFEPGETLIREGDPSSHAYVLLEGWVRVSALKPDGGVVLLALRGPGDIIGELAAIHGWERTATVQALDAVHAVRLLNTQFLDRLRDNPDVSMAVIKTLSVRLREAEETRLDMASLSVSGRLAAALARLAAEHGVPSPDGVRIDLPLTQDDLADRIGASRRAVARSLHVFRTRGVVHTARKAYVVARPDVLRSLSHSVPDGTEP
jgi:CRP/FNR family cyclic AMP-dependent transcriptional regulator